MRLRHKKPLNPYKGQTNNDKNEFNDDDFRQQTSPTKKITSGSTDQIYKYAKLLSKFIKTVNQQHQDYLRTHGLQALPPNPPLTQEPLLNDLECQALQSSLKGQEIKRQNQTQKLQPKKEQKEDTKVAKVAPKRKEPNSNPASGRENRNKSLENAAQNGSTPSKNSIIPKSSLEPAKNEAQLRQINGEASSQMTANFPPKTNHNPGFLSQPPKNNQNPAMNMTLNGNLQNYLGMQGFMNPNQLLSLDVYNQLQQMGQIGQLRALGALGQLGQMPMRYGQMEGMMPGYMPMNMPMNMNMMGLGLNNQMMMQHSMKPVQNLFNEQAKNYNQKNTTTGNKNSKQVYPLKRSAFHVAIAYKIYLDKLKKQGKNIQNLEDIDPTRNARLIKGNQNERKSRSCQKKNK